MDFQVELIRLMLQGQALLIEMFELVVDLAGLAFAPVMLGAIFMVHWGRWNFTPADGFPMGGMEFQVILSLIAVYVVIVGNATATKSA